MTLVAVQIFKSFEGYISTEEDRWSTRVIARLVAQNLQGGLATAPRRITGRRESPPKSPRNASLHHHRGGSLDNEVRRRSGIVAQNCEGLTTIEEDAGCRGSPLEQQDRRNGYYRYMFYTFKCLIMFFFLMYLGWSISPPKRATGQRGSPSEPPGSSPKIVKKVSLSPKRIIGQRGSLSDQPGLSLKIIKRASPPSKRTLDIKDSCRSYKDCCPNSPEGLTTSQEGAAYR
ncbi:uncharacterized protein LOC130686953 [Daphnia carinata]|uniref:uncharacterized protein LOC130686952 n=1 Tax=Daphnia carinata TaxID=120202 RepID=UPI0028692C22|nr:uncharacterized protein LOC130686952 [Daphnia carinata]XP_059350117.1 uncharacterized protein LOC130686953 [Daphnia carinata]